MSLTKGTHTVAHYAPADRQCPLADSGPAVHNADIPPPNSAALDLLDLTYCRWDDGDDNLIDNNE